MQRMRLHTAGVKVPKLGTMHDRVLRNYLTKESALEISKMRFTMLQTMVTPDLKSEQAKTAWLDEVKQSWDSYLSALLLYELPKEAPKDKLLREYYENVIAKIKPVITKDKKTGNLSVTGIDPKLL